MAHHITANEVDISCDCGWYDHERLNADWSATAHILRNVVGDAVLADAYETDYRRSRGYAPKEDDPTVDHIPVTEDQ